MTAKFHMGGSDPGIGDGRAEVGSEQWARRVRAHMVTLSAEMPKTPKYLAGSLRLLREREGWKLLTDKANRPFTSLEEFCEAKRPWGLDMKLADLERWLDRTGPASAPMYWNPDNGEEVEVHPAANLFPMLSKESLAALAADIQTNGLAVPIVLWEGKVIDGRNRLAACQLAGIEPTFTELTHCPDPVAFVLSANLRRRQMTDDDRALCAAEQKAYYMAKAKAAHGEAVKTGGRGNKKTLAATAAGVSDSRWYNLAAKDWEVSADAIQRADAILQRRGECPALYDATKARDVSLSAAATLAKAIDKGQLGAAEVTERVATGKAVSTVNELRRSKGKRDHQTPIVSTKAIRAASLDNVLAAQIEAMTLATSDAAYTALASALANEEIGQDKAKALRDRWTERHRALVAAKNEPPPAPPPAPSSSGQATLELDAPTTPEAPDAPEADDLVAQLHLLERELVGTTPAFRERARMTVAGLIADARRNRR